jgi:hypothetical protein
LKISPPTIQVINSEKGEEGSVVKEKEKEVDLVVSKY